MNDFFSGLEFLREIFIFIVENTSNIRFDKRIKTKKDLEKAIIMTEDNQKLERLCLVAYDMKEINLMYACIEKLSNAVHISNIITYIIEDNFSNDPSIKEFINALLDKMTNNIYIERILEAYFRNQTFTEEDKLEFIDKHIHQMTNNQYLYLFLEFLVKNNNTNLAIKHQEKLTNKTYYNKFKQLLISVDKIE